MLPAALPALFSTTLSPALSVYLCATVGPQGLLVVRLPAQFVPHSASLGPSTATRVLSAPVPISAPPTGLDECLFFISLVSDFLLFYFLSVLDVRGDAVSTYAAILVLSSGIWFEGGKANENWDLQVIKPKFLEIASGSDIAKLISNLRYYL